MAAHTLFTRLGSISSSFSSSRGLPSRVSSMGGRSVCVAAGSPSLLVTPRRYFSREEGKVQRPEMEEEEKKKLGDLMKFEEDSGRNMLPRQVVTELDNYIIGQNEAKRAVAIALRNRWRRRHLDKGIKEEVVPKNILMIGPTGVGKTEIARRLAKLISAPFIKVEATKFTEIGFHGRDVDQIIRDLVDVAILNCKTRFANANKAKIDEKVDKVLLEALIGPSPDQKSYLSFLKAGEMDSMKIEIEMPESSSADKQASSNKSKENEAEEVDVIVFQNLLKAFDKPSAKKKTLTVGEARKVLEKKEKESVIDNDALLKIALHETEHEGIVFIDEIDKICEAKGIHHSADASSEGVQRDLLPIVEGCTIETKYGNIDTSRILFIASGAFHSCRPSDMISELQGRLPIRVELKALSQQDLIRILREPKNNLLQQQISLMKTEGVELKFTDSAVNAIARIANHVNEQVENIGARRLHTIIERIMEDISFNCDKYAGQVVEVDEAQVVKSLGDLLQKTDLTKFIL